jgi:pimeloyl-ACP methyl ester carboxylesterase
LYIVQVTVMSYIGHGGGRAPGPGRLLDRIPEAGPPDWVTAQEFDHYVDEFTRNSFTAPLNWYRCLDRNWKLTETTAAETIALPSLVVGGAADPTPAYMPRHRVGDVVSGDYREVMIDWAGHRLQQERPAEINEILVGFLAGLELT